MSGRSGDDDFGAFLDEIEQADHVPIGQSDASEACGGSQQMFLVRPVEVDVTGFGVGVFRVSSVQPEDACLNMVIRI